MNLQETFLNAKEPLSFSKMRQVAPLLHQQLFFMNSSSKKSGILFDFSKILLDVLERVRMIQKSIVTLSFVAKFLTKLGIFCKVLKFSSWYVFYIRSRLDNCRVVYALNIKLFKNFTLDHKTYQMVSPNT